MLPKCSRFSVFPEWCECYCCRIMWSFFFFLVPQCKATSLRQSLRQWVNVNSSTAYSSNCRCWENDKFKPFGILPDKVFILANYENWANYFFSSKFISGPPPLQDTFNVADAVISVSKRVHSLFLCFYILRWNSHINIYMLKHKWTTTTIKHIKHDTNKSCSQNIIGLIHTVTISPGSSHAVRLMLYWCVGCKSYLHSKSDKSDHYQFGHLS